VACLFTSHRIGKHKDPPSLVLENTDLAMVDLLRQVAAARAKGMSVGELRMCQINSGLFKVPWQQTMDVLSNIEVDQVEMPNEVTVFVRA
jgi:ADP-ribose 1''-phosphate phosphatase